MTSKPTRRALLASAVAVAAAPIAAALPLPMPELEMVPIGSATPVPLPAPEFLRVGDWLQFKVKTPFLFDPEVIGLEDSNLYEYHYAAVLEVDHEINRLTLSGSMPAGTVEIHVVERPFITGSLVLVETESTLDIAASPALHSIC